MAEKQMATKLQDDLGDTILVLGDYCNHEGDPIVTIRHVPTYEDLGGDSLQLDGPGVAALVVALLPYVELMTPEKIQEIASALDFHVRRVNREQSNAD